MALVTRSLISRFSHSFSLTIAMAVGVVLALLSGTAALGATITQTQGFAVSGTGSVIEDFAGFDPTLGALQSVRATVTSTHSGNLSVPAFSSRAVDFIVGAPLFDLMKTATASCSNITTCNAPVNGVYNPNSLYVNPFSGTGQTPVALSFASDGDLIGNWSGSVALQYRYRDPGTGSLLISTQNQGFSHSLSSTPNFSLFFDDFDQTLGSLEQVLLIPSSSYSGSLETDAGEDRNVFFSITGEGGTSITKLHNLGGTCGNPFGGCDDNLNGPMNGTDSLVNPYVGVGPVAILFDVNSTSSYSGNWSGNLTLEYQYEPVPEPGTGVLIGLGLIALATTRRR
jgi:hypothetical protein